MNIKSLERIHKLLKEDVKEKYAARDVLEIKRNEADSFDRTIEKAYQEAYAECETRFIHLRILRPRSGRTGSKKFSWYNPGKSGSALDGTDTSIGGRE